MAIQLEDSFKRQFYYLRLSVTDVCNFKCTYCLPDGYVPPSKASSSFLSLDEIRRVTHAFASCGTTKVRITGGEPSMRKDFCDIIETVSDTPGIKTVATTTNGYRLEKHVAEWQQAGLTHINVSVDSLNANMFRQITGQNKFTQVMAGIDRALGVGYRQIKVNTVLLKQFNLKELPTFLMWIKERPIQLRFIELMQTGEMDSLFDQQHVSGEVIRTQLVNLGWKRKARQSHDGPAQVFTHEDYAGEIGLIMPYEAGFCASCNRLRVSARGKLHLCLFGEHGVELRDLLQADGQTTELIQRIDTQLQTKTSGHQLHLGNSGSTPHLASIGG